MADSAKAAVFQHPEVDRVLAASKRGYKTRGQRAALRCGMHDATIIADYVAREIREKNTSRGRLTKHGAELEAVAKLIGDTVWAAYQQIGSHKLPSALANPSPKAETP
jgi:hypothetical protein